MPVNLSPDEARGVLRIALHDGGQTVSAHRVSNTEPVEVGFSRPVAGEALLWVDERGRPCRVVGPSEAAVAGTNLLPLKPDEIDPLPGDEEDPTLAVALEYDLAVELSNLADEHLDGGRDTSQGQRVRDRMRVLLAELDRRGAA